MALRILIVWTNTIYALSERWKAEGRGRFLTYLMSSLLILFIIKPGFDCPVGCSRQRHFHCTVNAMPGHHPFAMHYGMPHGCNPPTPPHMLGCMTPPPPPPFFAPHRMNFTARKMGFGVMPQGQMLGCGARCYRKGHGHGQGQGCRRSMNQDGVPQFRFG